MMYSWEHVDHETSETSLKQLHIYILYIYILVCINVRMLSPTSRIISAHVSILSDVTCFCRELRTSALPLRRVSKYVDAAS